MVSVLARYSWALHFVTIALSSYLVAQALSTAIAARLASRRPASDVATQESGPSSEEKVLQEIEEYKVIAERNIFNSEATALLTDEEVPPTALPVDGAAAVKTALDVKVLGALVVGEGSDRRSSASVQSGKESDVYFVADEKSFGENIRLVKVMRDRIEFFNGNRLEFAELEGFAAQRSVFESVDKVHGQRSSEGGSEAPTVTEAGGVLKEGDRFVVERGTIDEALANLDRFYTEVRVVPFFKEGKVSGMKILSVKPGSIVGKLGLKRGDVLEKINGQSLDVRRGMALFNELKDQASFTIDLIRGGQNKTFEYEVR